MNTKLTPHGKEALLRICQLILDEPRKIYMDNWLIKGDNLEDSGLQTPPCGTVGCIAGWIQTLYDDGKVYRYQEWEFATRFLFGFNKLNDEDPLFFIAYWPEQFIKAIGQYKRQTPEYAQVVVDRIHHFIETGE